MTNMTKKEAFKITGKRSQIRLNPSAYSTSNCWDVYTAETLESETSVPFKGGFTFREAQACRRKWRETETNVLCQKSPQNLFIPDHTSIEDFFKDYAIPKARRIILQIGGLNHHPDNITLFQITDFEFILELMEEH